jgi:acetyl esterase/lipase
VARSERPPFLVFHGSHDPLVRPGDSVRLVEALRNAGGPEVAYAEFPGATHGFDVLHSVRSRRAVDGIAAVLGHLWCRHREGSGRGRAREPAD